MMARNIEIAVSAQGSREWSGSRADERWPPLHAALFALGASVALWAGIIMGLRWLVA